jgi:hypothetical protein
MRKIENLTIVLGAYFAAPGGGCSELEKILATGLGVLGAQEANP